MVFRKANAAGETALDQIAQKTRKNQLPDTRVTRIALPRIQCSFSPRRATAAAKLVREDRTRLVETN